MALKVGDMAPDFELPAVEGERVLTVKLSDYREKKNVVVSFHPLDWTPTCGAQVPAFDADREKFSKLGAQVLDISVDSIPSKVAWQKKEIGILQTPMCADFYPHGKVSEQFGVLRLEPPFPGVSERAVFIVDRRGKIAFAKVYPLDQAPNNEELLEALEKIGG
jgi:peroxiredoxin (alkyl hydroperoxide reductase subunit C)